MLKKCSQCKRVLPEEMFAPNSSRCRLCRRDYDWQYRYGISPEQYFEMYTKQKGKCAICGKVLDTGEYLLVDHEHQTGEVRGLLCKSCNSGLSFFKDNPKNLQKAIKYLEKNDATL